MTRRKSISYGDDLFVGYDNPTPDLARARAHYERMMAQSGTVYPQPQQQAQAHDQSEAMRPADKAAHRPAHGALPSADRA